jgi:hypothetical protein
MTSDDSRALRDAFDRLANRIEELQSLALQSHSQHQSVSYGEGRGVWICVTCCLLMLVATTMGMFQLNREVVRQNEINNRILRYIDSYKVMVNKNDQEK